MKNTSKTRLPRHPLGNICGVTMVGARGQVVVPKEARDLIKIKEGDRLVVFEHDGFLIMLPEKIVSGMLKIFTNALKRKN